MIEELNDFSKASCDLQAVISERYEKLRKSEKRVADYILQYAEDVTNSSIVKLAKKCNTSEATVNRLCHSIGFSGYTAMKIMIARNIAQSTIKTVPKDINEDDDIETVSQKLKQHFIRSIEGTLGMLKSVQFLRLIESIEKARKIYMVGTGGSGNIARIAHQLFLKAGIFAIAYDNSYLQAISASLVGNGDLVIGFSHSGNSMDTTKALRIAKSNGAMTVAITGNPDSMIVKEADIVISTFSNEEPIYGDFMEAKISQLLIVDILYVGILLRNIPLYKKALESTAAAIWDRNYQQRETNAAN